MEHEPESDAEQQGREAAETGEGPPQTDQERFDQEQAGQPQEVAPDPAEDAPPQEVAPSPPPAEEE